MNLILLNCICRHKNSGLDAKTKQAIANDIDKIISELEDQVILHIQAFSLLTKIPVSIGSNRSIEQISQSRKYQPIFPQSKNSNVHVWIGGVHRVQDHQPTKPKLYYLEAVLMCGGHELLTPVSIELIIKMNIFIIFSVDSIKLLSMQSRQVLHFHSL